MEFLYLSPEFPPNYANFVLQLDKVGANVWAIGEANFYSMPKYLRSAISYYMRADLMSMASVENAVAELLTTKAAMGTPARFDMVESHNEMWLALEAGINRKYRIDGILPGDLDRLKRKSVMKERFHNCGLPTARGKIASDPDQAVALADQLGYPVILKPDEGVGASGIHRIESADRLRDILPRLSGPHLMEEFIDAPIVSYDGLVDQKGNLLFENSLVYGDGVLAYVQGKDTFFYVNREIDPALSKIGARLIREFDVRRKFFHFEFFHRDGRYLPIEINCRPPGGSIIDMMNYSVDDDLYAAYAQMAAGHQPVVSSRKKYYCAYVGRRDGRYALDHKAVLARYPENLVEHGENPLIYQGAMSRYRYIVRSPDLDLLMTISGEILDKR